MVTSPFISIEWCFRPYKPYIFWKLIIWWILNRVCIIVSLYHGIMGGNLHGGDASSSHLPLSGSFLGGFSERDIRFGGTNVYVGTNFCRWWWIPKLGHLHAQPPMSAVAAPSLITWDPLQFATIGGGLQWQMGLLEEKRCFHLNLLLALDHPLPSGHLADVHQGAVRQQWSELSVKIQQYSLQRHSWPERQKKFWQSERKPLGLQIHVVKLNANIPFHVAKALLSKSYWGGEESGFKTFSLM